MRLVRHLIVVGHMLTRRSYGYSAARVAVDTQLRRKARKLTTQPQPVWLTPEQLTQREQLREQYRRSAWLRAQLRSAAHSWTHSHATDARTPRAADATRLTYSTRYGLRLMVSATARETAAQLDAAEAGTVNRDRVAWTERNATRSLRAKLRAGVALTAAEQAQLDAAAAVLTMTPGAVAEAVAPLDAAASATEGYDAAPWRGMVAARETRYSPRGADAPGKRGTASRVSMRDAHAATQSDEYGLAATTVKPLSTYGVSVPAHATPEQAAWLLSTVKRQPALSTYTRRTLTPDAAEQLACVPQAERLAWLAEQPASSWHTQHGQPVPVLSIHEAHRLRAERHDATQADHAAAQLADRVALLRGVTTHTAEQLSS